MNMKLPNLKVIGIILISVEQAVVQLLRRQKFSPPNFRPQISKWLNKLIMKNLPQQKTPDDN